MVKGIVQGVGFRPFIYSLAQSRSLKGQVFNNAKGVLIDVEGQDVSIRQFIDEIKTNPPPLSFIESVEFENYSDPANYSDFRIIESDGEGERFTPVSPDVAVCADCLREMFDPGDRRYLYPFINCTNCGPRFTIIKDIPYDRPMTTMGEFEMCEACRAEYENPLDRRFHAEPTACPECGPNLRFEIGTASGGDRMAEKTEAVRRTQKALTKAQIVAVKGVGGFHLACDARSDAALQKLRERKGRIDKPFAIMVRDPETARKLVEINPAEEEILIGKERPIVLLKKKRSDLSRLIAPNNQFLGVMLPYSPLHFLLFAPVDENCPPPDVLVMTSGNFTDEPIVKDNGEALEKLSHLADAFLLHNREIYVQCDDSVVRISDLSISEPKSEIRNPRSEIPNPKSQIIPIRRSRGYAPFPVELPFEIPNILAVGGELKAAFCLTRENFAFMSQHIGDMENLETLESFEKSFGQMKALFRVEPEIIACDKHPGYLSSNWAREAVGKIGAEIFEVQHHHAHIASVMAENVLPDEPVIGFAFDGTGFGDDGAIWGGEVLVGGYGGFERAAHLNYFPLAGGDASIKRPYRVALSLLREAGVDWDERLDCVSFCSRTEQKILAKQLENDLNVVPTSSFGRLFDAVAALAGVRQQITYEAQAAIEFEAMLDEKAGQSYEFDLIERDTILIDWKNMIKAVAEDVLNAVPVPLISAGFHNAAAGLILKLSLMMREKFNLNRVALSGGCFQNVVLLRRAIRLLSDRDFEVFTHRKVPPNDGGLALGQAVVAGRSRYKEF
ncbi:MAG: carbamoyltransferase HypF [Pyrinomonadaceae bacterium]